MRLQVEWGCKCNVFTSDTFYWIASHQDSSAVGYPDDNSRDERDAQGLQAGHNRQIHLGN